MIKTLTQIKSEKKRLEEKLFKSIPGTQKDYTQIKINTLDWVLGEEYSL